MENTGGTAVIFRSNGELYAFTIGALLEINNRTDITPVPGLPDCISGVINLMGEVIPVIDLRKRLNFPDCVYESRSCLMVIKNEETTAAVRVDEVLTSHEYTDGENFLPLDDDGVVLGFINSGEERISLLNEAKILDIKR